MVVDKRFFMAPVSMTARHRAHRHGADTTMTAGSIAVGSRSHLKNIVVSGKICTDTAYHNVMILNIVAVPGHVVIRNTKRMGIGYSRWNINRSGNHSVECSAKLCKFWVVYKFVMWKNVNSLRISKRSWGCCAPLSPRHRRHQKAKPKKRKKLKKTDWQNTVTNCIYLRKNF